jgi:hypothetical protein
MSLSYAEVMQDREEARTARNHLARVLRDLRSMLDQMVNDADAIMVAVANGHTGGIVQRMALDLRNKLIGAGGFIGPIPSVEVTDALRKAQAVADAVIRVVADWDKSEHKTTVGNGEVDQFIDKLCKAAGIDRTPM